MNRKCVTWEDGVAPLGRSVVAIGVFDGVHVGHQALLRATVQEARARTIRSVALTFDRDPDQVVTPDNAAPQLLSLNDKCGAILECGIDTVLVVPFTPAVAQMRPEDFLDAVLAQACTPVAIHVGHDFRFGAGAAGDVDALYVWGVEHGADVHPHRLVDVGSQPVSSTRIRGLVAAGDVAGAAELLGRGHRVTGTVHEGRRQGGQLGFPTANVAPAPYSALPADGVYAGRALTTEGVWWPAAISVGTPPTFPAARDYLEAHLIGYAGDLYGQTLELEFVERLRPLTGFASLEELSAAIARDVATTVEVVGEASDEPATAPTDLAFHNTDAYFSDSDIIEDPEALAAAEAAVAALDGGQDYTAFDETWVTVMGPTRIASLFADGGVGAFMITSPLRAAGIPFAWDPFSPEETMQARPDFNWWRTFSLLVPPEHAADARELLGEWAAPE